ncbi:TMhelix containing protein [Vibrio phage 1.244.A._10N.261.54.C3]|nr:TMhelix containing protein [Vibrio phage 1.244.A._10N.261.54.C3]AUR98777.1 coil containing protein [Vibrio phage 1.255.O._10N.286.45.F1]
MFLLVMTFAMFIAAAIVPFLLPKTMNKIIRSAVCAGLVFLGLVFASFTSTVNVEADKIGILNRTYMAANLPAGRIMMVDEEGTTYKGPQPEYITEGFHMIPFVSVLNDIDYVEVVEVPQGQYLKLVAREGKPLPKGEFMAPEWTDSYRDMLEPKFFLNNGGYKGAQLTVLPPGKYPIHTGLWTYKFGKATTVQTGEVAVIRSNVNSAGTCEKVKRQDTGDISTILVAKGCKGIWDEPLSPGRFYLNDDAYTATIISTRAVSWKYKGGYIRRDVALSVGKDGSIIQKESKTAVEVKGDFSDSAVLVRTKDGQTVPMEVRVQAQVQAKDAPRVVAGVGTMDAVEDRIVAPVVADILRQVGGQTEALKLVDERGNIVDSIENAIIPEAAKAGVTITEARLDDIVLPPELLLPQRRNQLATSLKDTYTQESLAAMERAKAEKENAIADQQGEIVKAEMYKKAQKLRGEGDRDQLIEIAKGQAKQVAVLGRAAAVQLQQQKQMLEALAKNPELVKVPMISVQGGSGGMEGAAAILGASSNMAAFMKSTQK